MPRQPQALTGRPDDPRDPTTAAQRPQIRRPQLLRPHNPDDADPTTAGPTTAGPTPQYPTTAAQTAGPSTSVSATAGPTIRNKARYRGFGNRELRCHPGPPDTVATVDNRASTPVACAQPRPSQPVFTAARRGAVTLSGRPGPMAHRIA